MGGCVSTPRESGSPNGDSSEGAGIPTLVYYNCFFNLVDNSIDWLALHLKFGSVYFQQFGGISRPHVDQLQI